MKIIRQVVDKPAIVVYNPEEVNYFPPYTVNTFAPLSVMSSEIKRGFYRAELPVSKNDYFYTVEKGFEHRPDLISYKFYGNVKYWWIICDINNIINPFFISVGMLLKIPDKNNLKYITG